MAKRRSKKKKTPGFLSRLVTFVVGLFVEERFAGLRKIVLVVIPFLMLIAGAVWGMAKLEGYVKYVAHDRGIPVEVCFVGEKPAWATDALIEKINASCKIGSDVFLLEESLVKELWANLSQNPWVESISQVRKCYSGKIEIDYKLREPIAVIIRDDVTRYLDAEGVVLDCVAVQKHLIRIDGSYQAVPLPGHKIMQDDVMAALKILSRIAYIDGELQDESERIWTELARIDISNYQGRNDSGKSHINLFTHKNTEIRWGVQIGSEVGNLEAEDKDKLTKLFTCYTIYGTLDISSAGIELRPRLYNN